MTNKKIKTCYKCNGKEPCDLAENSYYSHRIDGYCIWKYIVMMDIQKHKKGIECLTFPDVRDLE